MNGAFINGQRFGLLNTPKKFASDPSNQAGGVQTFFDNSRDRVLAVWAHSNNSINGVIHKSS